MSYTAQIRIKCAGVQVYQESQTFARKEAAKAWVGDVRQSLISLVRLSD